MAPVELVERCARRPDGGEQSDLDLVVVRANPPSAQTKLATTEDPEAIGRSKGTEEVKPMSDIGATSSITIEASAEEVWKALMTPELIKQWFFGVATETDWQVGGPLIHRGAWQGKPYEAKGEILRIEPPKLLVHTHWSALSGLPDRPENYEQITWALSERKGVTELTITERNLPSEQAKAVSVLGWKTALSNLKKLLEQ